MRKMPYAVIFIVIIAILVFAGCKALSGDKTTDPSEDGSSSGGVPGAVSTTDPLGHVLDGIEDLTGEDGSTLFSEDEISSLHNELSSQLEEESRSEAAAATTQTPDVSEPAGDDATEAPGADDTAVSTENTTSAPVENTTAAKPTSNEYDILRSGSFYMDGTMYSEGQNNPVTLAVNDDLVYMQATMDGMTMGLLVQDKKTYLLNPPTKTYCEFGSVLSGVLKKAGMMSEDEIKEFIDSMGFSTMEDLADADSVTTGTIGSTACDVYVFSKDDGSKTRVYLAGEHLMAFEKVDADGTVNSATYINTLTSEIPKLPPKDYTKQNALSFVMSMEEMMGD